MDFVDIYNQHKKTILIVAANLVGMLVIILLVVILKWVAEGSVPVPDKAPPQDVVNYLASPKFSEQSDASQLQYMQQTVNTHYSPQGVNQLSQAIDKLSESQRVQLSNNFVNVMGLQTVEDSKVYQNLKTKGEQRTFIDSKLQQWDALRSMVTGQPSSAGGVIHRPSGSGGFSGPNLAAKPGMSKNIPSDPPGMYKMFLDRNKPSDRAMMETYIKDIQQRIQQQKAITKAQNR
ncbi:MAG: hypothetical protein WC975_07675 [Phycisphaerae bacterium]